MELSRTFTNPSATIFSAHNICLRAEQQVSVRLDAPNTVTQSRLLQKDLVNIRILGHLLTVGPTLVAQEYVASSISSCKDLEELVGLGDFFDKHFIRFCITLSCSEASWYTDWLTTDSEKFESREARRRRRRATPRRHACHSIARKS